MSITNIFSRLIIVGFIAVFIAACSDSEDGPKVKYTADFEYAVSNDNPNIIEFTNTSDGEYLYLQWDYGKDEGVGSKESDKTSVRSIYYPLKGSYEVTLVVWGSLNNSSDTKKITKTITINQDDPDYIEPQGLIWSDEFDGSSIDLNNWTFETGSGGWGNQELQYYTNGENAAIEGGKLIITAKKVNDNKTEGAYTSSRMVTLGKQEFTYGRIEVRAKLPSGTGIWPAIWMLGSNITSVGWPACGEIDIMEYVGYDPNIVHSTVHTPTGYAGDGDGSWMTLETAEEDFHIYGLIWSESSLTFYVDTPDNVVHVYAPVVKNSSNWPFDKPCFFILNIAVGGTWGGAQGIDNAIFPQTMEVDYVRVYSLD